MVKHEMLLVGIIAICIAPACAFPGPDGGSASAQYGDSLSLEQCLEIAAGNSNQIAITEGNVTKAEIGVKDARAGFLPELHLTGAYSLNDEYNKLEWNDNHYSLSLVASVTPFNGGRNFINVWKSRESLSSAEQGLRLTWINLALDVMTQYYNMLESSEILELRKESLAQKRTHLDFARTQYGLGLVPKSDVLKAEVAVVAGEIDSLEADGDMGIARAELNNAMGVSLDNPTTIKPVKAARAAPPGSDDCLRAALENRPELLQQQHSLAIGKHNVRLAQIERWPKITLVGTYNAYIDQFVSGDLELNRANWGDNTDWRLGLGLSLPLFNGGITGRAVEEARINLEQTELDYSDLKKQINLEVKSAHLNLVTALKKIDLAEKEVESAEESYNSALGRYRTGVAPITEVIDAAVALTNSKVSHTRAIYEYLLAEARLDQAMGQSPYKRAGRQE